NPFRLDQDQSGVVLGVAFSPDGRRLAVASVGRVQVFNAEGSGWSPGPIMPKAIGAFGAMAVAFHPGGNQIAAAGHDRVIRLWNPDTDAVQSLPGHEGFIRALAYNRDGSRLASAAEDRTVRLWDLETGRHEAIFRGHQGFETALAFHPDGKRLISGGLD